MKKTAMQLLIEELEEQKEVVPIEVYQKGLEYAIQAAKLKLETERQDHERTYIDAFVNSDGTRLKVDFEQYYKDTYE